MKRQTKLMAPVVVLSIALSVAPLSEAQPPADDNKPLTVMTWNLYVGAPLEPLFAISSFKDLVPQGTAIWATVRQTNFHERAGAIAGQIAQKQPDLIGLQEAVLWRIQSPGDFVIGHYVPNATTVAYDFLQILLDALEAHGLHYEVLVVVEGSDFEGPALNPNSVTRTDDIRLTDRDVILARSDVQPSRFQYSNVQGENFHAKVVPDILGLPVELLSNWASVDVNAPDGTLRFVTTHLSALYEVVRLVQVGELLAGPLDTDLPVVLVGDLNSNATVADPANDAPVYNFLISYGFTDTWMEAGTGDGFTWGQSGNLLNPESTLDQRIDFVLYLGDFTALSSDVVGEHQEDRTPSGLWPSDHAGVSTVLMFNAPEGQ